ncbi:MAG TPA: phosphatidylinositol mannoside acyltransferase [Actinomycetota bacterium]|nr:phosphatidylinositol mannoside acyltransferase [Actinomycetota bacterium]
MNVLTWVAEWGTYLVYRFMSWLGPLLPTRSGRAAYEAAGRLFFHVASGARATVLANQAQVLGRPVDDPLVRASTREAFATYARYWFDTFNVLGWDDERVLSSFRFEGVELVEKGLADGKGVLIALPHTGNWDVGGRAMGLRVGPVVSVAEHLKPERLFRLFLEHRELLRMEIIDLASDHVGRQLTKKLEENRVVALVADRDLSGGGVEVEMFGRTRRMPAGPALLSLSSGAPLLSGPTFTTKEGWVEVLSEVSIEPTGRRKDDIVALTRALASSFERAIASAPSDWHLFQPGWED